MALGKTDEKMGKYFLYSENEGGAKADDVAEMKVDSWQLGLKFNSGTTILRIFFKIGFSLSKWLGRRTLKHIVAENCCYSF